MDFALGGALAFMGAKPEASVSVSGSEHTRLLWLFNTQKPTLALIVLIFSRKRL